MPLPERNPDMETDPRFDENDLMDGQDIPLGHKKFLLMRSELLKMIRTGELTRTRSHQLLAMLSEACDANFTRGYRCGLDDSEEEIKRLRHELTEAKKAILNLTVGTGTDITHERQDADSSNAEFRRNYR